MENARKYIATGLVLLLGAGVVYLLRGFFLALFGAYVFSFLFAPVFIAMNRRINRPHLAAGLTISLILFMALVPLLLVAYTAYTQAVDLQANFQPEGLIEIARTLHLPTEIDGAIVRMSEDFSNRLAGSLPSLFTAASHLVISLFIMFFVMYYIFLNIHVVIAKSIELLPFSTSNAIWLVGEFQQISRSLLLGQIMVSALQGLLAGLGFWMFGLQDAALWGIVTAVASLIPLFGTALVWLPAGVLQLVHHHLFPGIGILLWGLLVVGTVDNLVRPLLVKRLGNINPVITLLGAFGGLEVFGIVGVVIGPILLAFFFLLVQVFRSEIFGRPGTLATDPLFDTAPQP